MGKVVLISPQSVRVDYLSYLMLEFYLEFISKESNIIH